MLLESSAMCNGWIKTDYLAKCDVWVGGLKFPLVVKVGDSHQPGLVGLDLMFASGMQLDFVNRGYTVTSCGDFHRTVRSFEFIDLDAFMKGNGIRETDLVPFHELPAIRTCLDLGTTTGSRALEI